MSFKEGWRTAEVLEVGAANTLQRRGITDCRESATADELQTRRFAAVGYRAGASASISSFWAPTRRSGAVIASSSMSSNAAAR